MTILNKKRKRPRTSQAIRLSFTLLFVLLAIATLSVLTGCRSIQQSSDSTSESTSFERETLIPIAVPSDSLTLRALFECDSLNNVLIKNISESKTNNVSTLIGFSNGILTYKATSKPDSVYARHKEKYSNLKTTFTINKQTIKKVYVYGFFWWTGFVFWIAAGAWLVYKLLRKIIELTTLIK